jgi:histidyl-tRNA synthetase
MTTPEPESFNYSLLSGFPEFLPGEKRLEKRILSIIAETYESYGFTPIETPTVERLEVLQAKDHQGDNIIYSISPIVPGIEDDEPGRGLKFDQTVPLAAYIARHQNDLTFPFARYQMDMVFRGERAKDGRYRQFRQCDIDVVGRGKLDLLYDAQMPAIITEIFEKLEIGNFLVRINNRKVLTGFFTAIGVEENLVKTCIKIVDEQDKTTAELVKSKLEQAGISAIQASEIIDFTNIKGSADDILTQLEEKAILLGQSDIFSEGIAELKTVITGVRSLKVPEHRFCIDLSIARGLGYYTGTVYETTLIGYEKLGSICSGGRYEELVGVFVGEKMPGVGISIGLTRLLYRLMKRELLKPMSASPAQVMVLNLNSNLMDTYLSISQELRQSGMNVLTVFEQRKIGDQFKQAEKLGIPFCVVVGDRELAAGTAEITILKTGEKISVSLDFLVTELKQRLA